MITFFDKNTQEYLTVYTKYPPKLITRLQEYEERNGNYIKDLLIQIHGNKPEILASFLRYNYFIEKNQKKYVLNESVPCVYNLLCLNENIDLNIEAFNELFEMLCKFGSINTCGEYLYYQSNSDKEKEILNSFNLTVNFNPLISLKEYSPHLKNQIEILMDEETYFDQLENTLKSISEKLSQFQEITRNPEILEALDNIFLEIENLYTNNLALDYTQNVVKYAFSFLTYGIGMFSKYDMYPYLQHKTMQLCAKILKHPMLYHFFFKEIIRDQGIHNEFFYTKASED